MNSIFDLIFNIVTSSIGIYVITRYLSSVDFTGAKIKKLFVNGTIDIDVVMYPVFYLLGSAVSCGILFFLEIKAKISWITSNVKWYPAITFVIFVAFALIVISKNKKQEERPSDFVVLLFIFINGFAAGPLLEGTITSYSKGKIDVVWSTVNIALYTAQYVLGILRIGMYHKKNDGIKVKMYLNQDFPVSYLPVHNGKALTNVIDVTIYEEKDDTYLISIGSDTKNYRMPKDQVVLIEEI